VNLAFFIAWRYLKAERKGLFAVVTTSIGVAGVMVGVAALITTLSVMNGFQADIQKKVIGAQSHLNVYGAREARDFSRLQEILNADPNVVATAPFVLGQAILSAGDRTIGMVLKGLDPEQEFKVNSLASSLSEGSWQGLKPAASSRSQGLPSPLPGIVLGEELARAVGAGVGSTVVLVSPKSVATPFGMLPKMQKFLVTGLLHTGYYEYDSTTGYSDIASTAKFFGIEAGATGVSARLHDLGRCAAAARSLQIRLGPAYVVRTYDQMNRTLFAALKLEKAVMFIILTLIILVAAFGIASTLFMMVMKKTRDIAILKSMGATRQSIMQIFIINGLVIGALGTIGGLGLGLGLCAILKKYQFIKLPRDVYYISTLPVTVQWPDVLAIVFASMAISFIATLYPAWQASRLDPVEAIRYE